MIRVPEPVYGLRGDPVACDIELSIHPAAYGSLHDAIERLPSRAALETADRRACSATEIVSGHTLALEFSKP